MKRFVELTIRKGSTFASLEKHSRDDLFYVLKAFSVYLPDATVPAGQAIEAAQQFLNRAGFWLNEKPMGVLLTSLKKGIIREATVGYQKVYRDPYTREALEEAILKEEDRRQRFRDNVRQVLQRRNREINSVKHAQVADDARFMAEALSYAREALERGEVPVGAVVVSDGAVVGAGGNAMIQTCDPSAHAEVIAIRKAAKALGDYRLPKTTLYVTLEPCAMCASLIAHARIARVVYGAPDPKAGACGGAFNLFTTKGTNHRPVLAGKVKAAQCAELLTRFFEARRAKDRSEASETPGPGGVAP